MPFHTRNWIFLWAVVGLGLLMAIVDFVVRQPGLALGAVGLVYVLTRPNLPMTYTTTELDRCRNTFARTLSNVVIPPLLLSALVLGTWRNWSDGPARALGFTWALLYVGDRVFAWVIRRAVRAYQHHEARRRARQVRLGDIPAAVESDAGVRDAA